MVREITLTQGLTTIVDDSDYAWLSEYKWHAGKSHSCWYAKATIKGHPLANNSGHVRMHRLLVDGLQKHEQVDHINRNSLDNRRANLRIVDVSEQQRNKRNSQPTTGVYKTRNNKYVVMIHGGRFEHESDAVVMARKIREFLESLRE